MRERIVVVGGNAAGMSAASRAIRLRPDLEITVVEASPFISYSICGLPYYLEGKIGDHRRLISFTPERLNRERGVTALTGLRAQAVLPGRRRLVCRREDGTPLELPFDRLVIATGYKPRVPRIPGLQLQRVLTVSRLQQGLQLGRWVERKQCRRAAIVGAGYVGLMMAHGLRRRGLEVLLFDRAPHVFSPAVDPEMGRILELELERNGVQLFLETRVTALEGRGGIFQRVAAGRKNWEADLALVDVGVSPNTDLAESCGLALGMSGAVEVDDRGLTSFPSIYAAGNCAETRHLVSGKPVFSALGTTAAKQGRVVGDHLAGRRSFFPGTLETSIEKVFDLGVARTGLTLRQALVAGFEAKAVNVTASHRAGYLEGSGPMHVRLVFSVRTGRLLGGQIIGPEGAAKRIDTLVAALTAGMGLEDLTRLDLAYAPPFGTLWDPIQIAASQGLKQI